MAEETVVANEVPAEILAFRQQENEFQVNDDQTPEVIMDGTPGEVTLNPAKEEEDDEQDDIDQEETQEDEQDSEDDSSEHPDKSEKRYKDVQKAFTKSQQKLKRLDGLVKRFDKFLKKDENGDPIDWDFSSLSKEEKADIPTKESEIPPEPTDEEWDLEPKEAAKKHMAREKYFWKKELSEERAKEREEERAKSEAEKFESAFASEWDEYSAKAHDHYGHAGFGDPKSEFVKTMRKIGEENPELTDFSNGNLIIAQMAAAELGILPAKKDGKTNGVQKTNTIGQNKKFLTQAVGGSNSKASTSEVPKEILDFRANEEAFKTGGMVIV